MNSYKYKLKGLDCANCARKIEDKLSSLDYLTDVSVNFSMMRLSFKSDKDIKDNDILDIIHSIESSVTFAKDNEDNGNKLVIIRYIISLFIGIVGIFIKNDILVLISCLILLYRTFMNAVRLIINNRQINENFLITISCIGAYIIGSSHEGLMVIALYELGKILEGIAVNRSRNSINDLISLDEEFSNVIVDGDINRIKTERVNIGDIILVKSGEKIPLDGKVVNGSAYVDTSVVTGESEVRSLKKEDNAISGCIIKEGILEIEVTSNYNNSTVKRIMDLVSNASDKKANTELVVNKIGKYYTNIVMILSTVVFITLPLITKLSYSDSLYRALIFLVTSCPCAIAISVPLSCFSSIGVSSINGILVKGSNYIDIVKNINEIVFDKTGTITTGNMEVSDIVLINDKYKINFIKKVVCSGEVLSNHPLAISINKYCQCKPDNKKVTNFKEMSGKGITYKYDGILVKIGNSKLVKNDIKVNSNTFISYNNEVIGYILFDDEIKKNVLETVKYLKNKGIKVSMLTGDNKDKAINIANSVQIDNVLYELLPEDKYNYIENLVNDSKLVAFVGDGVNDAPSLALSSVGISMGGIGTDAAISSSDIVIMNDDIGKIVTLFKISNNTSNIIRANLIFAIGTKVIILLLGLIGITGMGQAIFADVGVTLITIINSLRILKYKEKN